MFETLITIAKTADKQVITRNELFDLATQAGVPAATFWQAAKELTPWQVKKSPVTFDFNLSTAEPVAAEEKKEIPMQKQSIIDTMDATQDPNIDKMIRVEGYKRVEEYIDTDDKYPLNIYVYGESGVGKSTAVLAAAKKAKKKVVRINISFATDTDDLFGGIRLKDGQTFYEPGPLVIAAEAGAVVLLDEIDTGNPKMLSELYNALERRGFYVKKLNKFIVPASGFQIIATGNTKGDGAGSADYTGTNTMSKALRERFSVFIKYEVASAGELKRIIRAEFPNVNDKMVDAVADWHMKIADAVKNGVLTHPLGVRRLLDLVDVSIRKGASTPGSEQMMSAVRDVVSIFDDEIAEGLCALWDSMFVESVQ